MVSYLVQGIALMEYFLSNRDTHMAQLPSELKEDTKRFFSFDPVYASKIYKKSPEELRAIVNDVGTDMIAKNQQLSKTREIAAFFNYFVFTAIIRSIYKATCCTREDFWASREVKFLLKEEEVTQLTLGARDEFKACVHKIDNAVILEYFPWGLHWFMSLIIGDRLELDRKVDDFENDQEHVDYLVSQAPDITPNIRRLAEISKKFDALCGINFSLPLHVHRVAMKNLCFWLEEAKKDKAQQPYVELFLNEDLPEIAKPDPEFMFFKSIEIKG